MKKYLLVLVGLCCVLSYALAERPDYPELKKSDANIIGHVLDKKNERTSSVHHYRTERNDHRNRDRCYRALFFEEFAGRKFYTGS